MNAYGRTFEELMRAFSAVFCIRARPGAKPSVFFEVHMGERGPFDKQRGPSQRLAASAQMNWFERSWRSKGIRTLGELARQVRIASRSSNIGQDRMVERLRELSENYTSGHTPLADWYRNPLLWWLEHPEFMEALETVLGVTEAAPLRESYWAARSSYTRYPQDTLPAELSELAAMVGFQSVPQGAAAPQRKLRQPTVSITVVDPQGDLLDDDYRILRGYGLPRVGDFLSLSLTQGMGRVVGVTWQEEHVPAISVEILSEDTKQEGN